MKSNVYRDGRVHVMAEKCATCIFRPVNDGRIQGLHPGRVAGMVQEARSDEAGSITCHATLYLTAPQKRAHAICRGFWDLPRRPALLDLAERMGVVTFQD